MTETFPFTIEQFYKFASERKLMAAKCKKCATMFLPPRPMCTKCFSSDLEWVELRNKGKLLTYTVIHVSPKQFESLIPYTVGIVKLEDGPKLPGMIQGVAPEKISVGMDLRVDFDTTIPSEWPKWPRYFFKPS
ncbi:MAG: Zn-ribbon domain-containing OB-fold protein [Candidatus Bathyarchaeota archaeon]|nr:MAG: Zn-ribbon domain-containing OB-fold protein [Candidatus Bathyarchaeota archaeon]